ncbi:hypothetical protein LRF89_09205 [Halorhodospira sp. 9621]|uniref:lipopolysaccharide kinase InaA family protein n=1 Tax=Halorhodospira sp. 9621 TaxID=2899135 RepID=UPI001EE96CF2|nr:lipopolysaccharide kinase InaA family protein [Halorhodospira sp. 9621]MCG5533614.1 hypothetical protein [Halorhodospira sp. 9621]
MLLQRPVQKVGKVRLYTPDGRAAEPSAAETALQLLEHGKSPRDAELISSRKSRIYRQRADGGRVYVKHYRSRRRKERIKRLIRSPHRNITLWRRLAALQIPAPTPLLLARKRREAVLVIEEMPTPTLREHIGRGEPVTSALMVAFGRTWGRLHNSRMIHYDPSPGNITLPEGNQDLAGLLDLDSVYVVPAVPAFVARHRLQRFFYKLTTECLRRQGTAPDGAAFQAFWHGYAEATGVDTTRHAQAVIQRMEARIGSRRKKRQGETFLAAARDWRAALETDPPG